MWQSLLPGPWTCSHNYPDSFYGFKESNMNFSALPDHSRIWIYQSNNPFTALQEEKAMNIASEFLEVWTSHQHKMKAAVAVFHKHFVIVGVDEQTAPASGCGIDKSLRFIQDLEKMLNVRLLDRMQVAWKEQDGILTASLSGFEALLKSGKIMPETLVFNNLVERKGQLMNEWIVPVSQSWHNRYLPL
jgi:hypothetical protein